MHSFDNQTPKRNPTFSGNVVGTTKTMIQLDRVDSTSDSKKPISTATRTALDLKANQADVYTQEGVDKKLKNLVNDAPASLDTLKDLAHALGNDANFSATIMNSIETKAR